MAISIYTAGAASNAGAWAYAVCEYAPKQGGKAAALRCLETAAGDGADAKGERRTDTGARIDAPRGDAGIERAVKEAAALSLVHDYAPVFTASAYDCARLGGNGPFGAPLAYRADDGLDGQFHAAGFAFALDAMNAEVKRADEEAAFNERQAAAAAAERERLERLRRDVDAAAAKARGLALAGIGKPSEGEVAAADAALADARAALYDAEHGEAFPARE